MLCHYAMRLKILAYYFEFMARFFCTFLPQKYFPRRTGGFAEGVVNITDIEMYFLAKFVVPENPFSNVESTCIVGVYISKWFAIINDYIR